MPTGSPGWSSRDATTRCPQRTRGEIGMRLNLAEITVKTHLTAIFRVLGVVNRTQAVVAIRKVGVDYGTV